MKIKAPSFSGRDWIPPLCAAGLRQAGICLSIAPLLRGGSRHIAEIRQTRRA